MLQTKDKGVLKQIQPKSQNHHFHSPTAKSLLLQKLAWYITTHFVVKGHISTALSTVRKPLGVRGSMFHSARRPGKRGGLGVGRGGGGGGQSFITFPLLRVSLSALACFVFPVLLPARHNRVRRSGLLCSGCWS